MLHENLLLHPARLSAHIVTHQAHEPHPHVQPQALRSRRRPAPEESQTVPSDSLMLRRVCEEGLVFILRLFAPRAY